MMVEKLNGKGRIGLIVVLIIFAVAISLIIWRTHSLYVLEKRGDRALESGDYLAALSQYYLLQEGKDSKELEDKIAKAKKFLIATENFKKAKKASESGEWLEVKPLLDDARLADPDFKYYEDVRQLYTQASEKIDFLEKRIESEIQQLKSEAEREKLEKEQAEQETRQIQSELQSTLQEKETYEQKASEAEQRAQEALRIAQEERFKKFINELALLIDVLESGNYYLGEAIENINNGKDDNALLFISRAKNFFDDLKDNAEELKKERTPADQANVADNLIGAIDNFISASKNLANSTFSRSEEDKFYLYFDQGKSLRNSAVETIGQIKTFVNSNK